MTWLALTSAIAIGIAVGTELSTWLGYLTRPLRARINNHFEVREDELYGLSSLAPADDDR